jgi:2-haloacid dehalogenase
VPEPVAARYGRAATAEQQREVGERMRQLPAHADATDAITRLREAGFGVVTLTNSVAAVAEDQLRNSGLHPLIDTVYSADEVGRLKPAPEPYRHVLKSEPGGAVLIAAHDWDTAGAAAAGLVTAFVSRDGRIPLPAHVEPSLSGNGLIDIADQLIERFAR